LLPAKDIQPSHARPLLNTVLSDIPIISKLPCKAAFVCHLPGQQHKPKTFVMTQFAKKTALVILTVAVTAAFRKDPERSKTPLLTSGGWMLISDFMDPAIDIDADGHTENELTKALSQCEKDNLMIFRVDNTIAEDEGATKCDPSDPQLVSTGTWKFYDNESKIIIRDSGFMDTAQLVQLSSSVLILKFVKVDSGITYAETLTLKHSS
jgi:hypothetical protein